MSILRPVSPDVLRSEASPIRHFTTGWLGLSVLRRQKTEYSQDARANPELKAGTPEQKVRGPFKPDPTLPTDSGPLSRAFQYGPEWPGHPLRLVAHSLSRSLFPWPGNEGHLHAPD